MHIPDGYLSPSTCAGLYCAAVPCWYIALKKIKANLQARAVPLLSVFAAFSFVIMMFNLPLPGGTTGHAVGMGIATIVLGPSVSIVAISIALLIQALFFGDGGVTSFGANCFNMAIVGSIAAYGIYRVLAWRSGVGSLRRVLAAGLAGYGAINLAALCAAIEFGIQPLYFHDATGAPLYAPYPLSVSIPAMMIGHLTLAGLAEAIVSSGLVRYLQQADPEMLRLTAPEAPEFAEQSVDPAQSGRRGSQGLWITLAVLLLLTPLGIVAVGSAWGEWSPADFQNPARRQEIVKASGSQGTPAQAPGGMQRLYSLWKAPLAGYAPSVFANPGAGYVGSAFAGVALVLALGFLLRWLLLRTKRLHRSFLERTIRHFVSVLQNALFAEQTALEKGFLQRRDPRVKLASFGALLLVTVATRQLLVILAVFCLAMLLAVLSQIPVLRSFGRVWVSVLAFTGFIAAPAIFLTPGTIAARVPFIDWPITFQGLRSAAFLTLRSETTATLAVLLIVSTLWSPLLRALRYFRVPAVAVVLAGMTYRYIFVFLQTAQSMMEARQVKRVGRVTPSLERRLVTASMGVLLDKSMQLSTEVHTAMQARGFRGEVYLLEDLQMQSADWLQLSVVFVISFAVLLAGR